MADFDTTTTTTTTYPYVSTAQATIDTSQIVTTGQFTEVEKPEEPDKPESNQKSYEELVLELAKVNAEKARFKNSIDKLTHENSELNKWKKERMIACTCIGCGRLLGKLGRSSRMLQKCGKCRIEMSFYIDDQYVMTVFPGWPKKAG